MLNIEALIILFNLSQCEHLVFLVAWKFFNGSCRRDKFNRIGLSYDFADVLSLEILLTDIARLVIKKSMRITHPCDTSEENHCFFLRQALLNRECIVSVGVDTLETTSSTHA